MDDAALRAEILRLMERNSQDDGTYVRASDLLDNAGPLALPGLRLGILRSFTVEPLIDVLRVKCFLEGWRLEPFLGEFNQYPQEILDPGSALYRFQPAVVLLAVRLEDLCPALFRDFPRLGPDELRDLQAEVVRTLAAWLDGLERHGTADVLLSNFVVPRAGALGLFDAQTTLGQVSIVRALNAELVRLVEPRARCRVFDVELLAADVGKERFFDAAQLYRASNPYRLTAYSRYGEWLMTHLRALLGRRRKCLVLDLDGTLWGGTVGEDGPEGIELSDGYPGNCFKEFQRSILRLHRRGVILAVNSKNNRDDALDVIRSHPDMVLREEHFSALRINWQDKVDNLREIARELNLGLDAMVLLDDSPVECARVREACPEVLVVQLPAERHRYPGLLDGLDCFEQLTLTVEDLARGRLYQEQAQRQRQAAEAVSVEEFLAGLEMRATLYRNERSHVARIAQLTQKTNQFNLTTRRYTDADIVRFMAKGCVYSLRVEDRFGDNGIVAVAIVLPRDDGEWLIDTLLMSCRVLLRTVEDTLLAAIADDARTGGATWLTGRYEPTPKNGMVAEFYRQRGFVAQARPDSGATDYAFDLTGAAELAPSTWIELTVAGALR